MAAEPADVLIIGAGASGGVVAKRLAEAGFKVVCLEQGDWHDRDDYPGNKLDWELHARKSWATSPNIRGLAAGLPDRRGRHAGLAAHVQRRRRLDAHLRRRLAARAPVATSASAASTASPTTGRSTTSSCCPTSTEPTATSASPGLPGDPAYPPDTEDAPMPPLPDRLGRDEGRPRHDEAGLALVAGVQLDQLDRLRRPAAVRPAQHLPVGLQRGRQGVDRPDPLAEGDRPRRAAHHRRPRPTHRDQRQGPRDRRDVDRRRRQRALRDRQGRRRRRERDRHAAAAAAVRQPRATPTAWRTRRASSGSG